jgi:Carboxypeptidase regulatory-like domain/Polysaccharide lyase family 4, domain II
MRIFGWFIAAVLALQAPPQQPQTGTGAIQGRVLRVGGTEPIAEAQVFLNRGNTPTGGGGGQRGGGAGSQTVSVITDDNGGFVFNDLAPGRYTVTAQHKRYSGPFINSPDPSAGVTVANGQTVEALITMTPTSVIRGRIRDVAGQFASNVQVEALVISYMNGLPFLMPAISKASDDRGEYRLYGLPPGDYYVGATPRPPSAIAALAGGDRSVKTFYPNEFDISRATKITMHGGEEIQNIDIAIQTPQMFKISGTVSSTVPVAAPPPTAQGAFAVIQQNQNATIQLILNSRDTTRPEGGNSGGTSVSVTAASAGPFEIANVLPGSYDLIALFNGNADVPAIARAVVDIRNQDVGGLVMTIRAGVQLRGSITVDGSAPRAGSVRMALTPADALKRLGAAMPADIAADGSFTIQGCPDGYFRLSVAPLGGDLYVDDIRQGGSSIYDAGFEIRGRNPDPIQVIIKSGAGTFDGTVQDASGKPLIGGTVALAPATRRQNDALYYVSRGDSSGTFAIRGIVPGEYKVFAWDVMPPGAYTNAAFLEKYEDHAIAVTIALGGKVTSKVTVLPR